MNSHDFTKNHTIIVKCKLIIQFVYKIFFLIFSNPYHYTNKQRLMIHEYYV